MAFQYAVIFQTLKEKRSVLLSTALYKECKQELRPGERKKGAKEEKDANLFEQAAKDRHPAGIRGFES